MKKGFIVFIILVIIGIVAYTIYKQNNPYRYQIIENYRLGGYDYSKRGYYIAKMDEENTPYYYIITMGEQNTGGYGLKVEKIDVDYYGNVHVIVREFEPNNNDIVSMAFTYPSVAIKFDQELHGITIKNTEGMEYYPLN